MLRRTSLFVLAILLVNLTGFFGYFMIRLNQIHEESKEALKYLPDSELDYFKLTPEEYRSSIINKREVRINDRMYDVARVIINENQVELYALHDEAEDNLLAFIRKVMTNIEKDGAAPSVFSQFAALHFLPSFFDWHAKLLETKIHHHTGYFIFLMNHNYLNLSPPPRSV